MSTNVKTATIEDQALALVNEVLNERGFMPVKTFDREGCCDAEAICRLLERHEALRQEVSEAANLVISDLERYGQPVEVARNTLSRFIIAPPVDPLVEALNDAAADCVERHKKAPWFENCANEYAQSLRAALAKHGLAIRKEAVS